MTRPDPTRWLCLALPTAALFGCHPHDECPVVGERWCEGTQMMVCEENDDHVPSGLRSGGNEVWPELDCAGEGGRDDATCMEPRGGATEDDWPECGLADVDCGSRGDFCDDGRPMRCSGAYPHPIATERCEERFPEQPFCVETPDGRAGCSPREETCDPDTDAPIWTGDHGRICCEDGIWVYERTVYSVADCAS